MAQIDVALALLDHQILDCDGRRCGNVDDLQIDGDEIVAILSGPAVWRQRAGWIGRFAAWVAGGGRVRVAWTEVTDVEAHVALRGRAGDYGLGRGDDRLRPYIEKIPGSQL